ncbi:MULTISPECIES: menaquinone biosynthetic enzyme MqnA/MqnD family protein [unclassified Paenibacillus]|uniref:menaquinone biosynthetic enzyme MqnA/MqnD family protein n=1 Tax=unclassified Paenibacillus TaxID=185978 RepID=UPI001C10B6CE|nr:MULTISPECIES: menaquinone biosynthesis protein [unclassified Paenibacillus]MBU5443967.1 menaquinone biosynthesis protein [Paenibacillus sp. MSJ-34]CAH0118748.1 Chorismate dehydratase [Paenibacillus sp. CECT 9249]
MNTNLRDPIRIGEINYANVWPMYFYFTPQALQIDVEMIQQFPTQLNRAMLNGTIDMGPISSFAYGASYERYMLFPDLSVSAFGPVKSILLFMKKPLEQVVNGRIALTTTSATSVNLLKIIIDRFYGGRPTYFDAEPVLEDMMKDADAALLIGDHAIRSSWTNTEYEILDLGECWRRWTGHWMTFAVWTVSSDAAARHPKQIRQIVDAFEESKQRSIRDPEPLVRAACANIGGTADYWRRYFNGLCHDFGQKQQDGLKLYFRYAKELGLIDKDVEIRIWSENSVV